MVSSRLPTLTCSAVLSCLAWSHSCWASDKFSLRMLHSSLTWKRRMKKLKFWYQYPTNQLKYMYMFFFNKHLWKLHQPIWLVSSIFIGTNNKEYKYFSTIVPPKRIIFNTDDNFMDQLSNQLNIGIQWKWNHSKFLLSYNT